MQNSLIITICLVIIAFGCNKKPHIINPELLKNDWISNDGNEDLLMFQDSLMIESLTLGDFPISPYSISNDTLIIYSQDFDYKKSSPTVERVIRYKIVKVDTLELLVSPAYPNFKDTMVFRKIAHVKKNDLKIKKLEFALNATGGPSQDIKIDNDSILYHYGYTSYSKYKGLTKCKLSSDQFESIQSRINAINFDSINLSIPAPGGSRFYLFIKNGNDSIEIDGSIHNCSNYELTSLLIYIASLEYFFDMKNAENEKIIFKDKRNLKLYKE